MANNTVYPYGTGGNLPSSIGVINDLVTGGADKALSAEMGKEIGDIIGESKVLESSFSSYTHFKDGFQLKANSAQLGKDLDEVDTSSTSSSNYVNVKVPVTGYSKAVFRQYGSGTTYQFGSVIVNGDDEVVAVATTPDGTGTPMSIDLPNDAAYLVYSYRTDLDYDKTVTLYKDDSILSRLVELEEENTPVNRTVGDSNATGASPRLFSGRIGSNGATVQNTAYVFTETIFGNFALQLADGWRVYEGHLYDRTGNMVSYQSVNPDVSHTGARGTWSNRTFMSIDNSVPEFGVRLVFCKSDQSAIADGEQPVDKFVSLSDSGLHRWIPNDLPKYDTALRRVDYLQSLRWTPLAKVPNGFPDSSSASATNVANTYFDLAGQIAIGVPYSDVAETRKYVPNNVSVRTFLTAVLNKRSVLYTEELHKNVSEYGMSYQQGNRRAYYGSVCCGFTAWVMGMDMMYLSSAYGSNTVPGLTTVADPSPENLRPLDLVWNEGHISIISDIYKDEFGNVKYIVWAEMSTPYPYRTLYTPEQFAARVLEKSAVVHRWDGWENLTEPEETEFSQYLLGKTRKMPEWGGDIMCFAGDYAAFAEGDTIYLNARRNSVYTGVELYKDDVLLQTIDITGLDADTIVTPNDEDWVKVNLTTLNLAHGKYKARLTDGTNTTDYTYFEVIDITMSATKNGSSSIIVTFNSTAGTPVTIEYVKLNGFPNAYHEITAEEVSAGSATIGWQDNITYKYLLMLVRGDYGTVMKRISFPSA